MNPSPRAVISRIRNFAPLLVALLSVTPKAHAINYTWNNTGTDWNSSASWNPASGSGIPNSGGDVVIFNSPSTSNPNLSSSVSISRITANSSSATGYTLTSSAGATITLGAATNGTSSAINYTPTTGSLALNAPIILGAAAGLTQTIHVNSAGGTVAIGGPVSSTNLVTLQKTGAGVLVLSSDQNSYSGGTLVTAGTLVLSGAGKLGSGDLMMNGGIFDISQISATGYTVESALTGAGRIAGGGKTFTTSQLALAGTLALEDITFSLSGVSEFHFSSTDFSAGSFDLVQGSAGTTENAIFGGTLSLSFSGGIYANGSSVRIFDVDGYSGAFSSITFSGLEAGQSVIFNASTGLVTVVPEPTSVALLSLTALGLLLVRCRKTRLQS